MDKSKTMNAEEIIARLIDSKAINGEEAICLLQSITPKEVFTPFKQLKEFGAHDNPYSPVYPQPSFDVTTTTSIKREEENNIGGCFASNSTLNTGGSTEVINEEVIIDAWLSRDKNGALCLWLNEPYKADSLWAGSSIIRTLPKSLFPEIKWEDDKPTKVKLTIKKV